MKLKTFFDKDTWTLTYVLFDPNTKDAVVVDPVWNFDMASGKLSKESFEELVGFIGSEGLKVHKVLETHAHADHISSAILLKEKIKGLKIAIGARITKVQEMFKEVFAMENLACDGSQFDELLDEGQELSAGSLKFRVLFTPGHTPACATYVSGDMAFVGDAIFMPDFGTGRCDFPGGSAEELYHSISEKLYRLPDQTRLLTGHDYMPGGRELRYESTVAEQKEKNIQLSASTTKEQFIKFRTERDKTLSAPKLLLPSIQVNINAGRLPEADPKGRRFLSLPLSLI